MNQTTTNESLYSSASSSTSPQEVNITKISDKLKILSDQFTANLTQYQTIYDEYKTLLSSRSMTTNATTLDASANSVNNMGAVISGKMDLYTTIPSSTYWGQTGLSEGASYTPSECLADCYSKPTCSGATFDADTNYCWQRSGDGRVSSGKSNQTAIIKKTILYEYQLKDLNAKLQKINGSINELITSNADLFKQNEILRTQRQTMLDHNRQILQQNEVQLETLTTDMTTMQKADENSSLMVNKNYYQYVFYLIIAIFLGFIFVKIIFASSSSSKSSPSSQSTNLIGGGKSNWF